MRFVVAACMLNLIASPAGADELLVRAGAGPRKSTIYVEVLGKAGLYSVGYERRLTPRFSLGGSVSAFALYGQRVVSASAYAGLYVVRGKRHGWFVHAGPQVTHVSVSVGDAMWEGPRSIGWGGHLASGWEYRNRIVVRVHAVAVAGRGGLAPWLGSSVGIEF